MSWKNLPYWLKGGLIGLAIAIILIFFLSPLIAWFPWLIPLILIMTPISGAMIYFSLGKITSLRKISFGYSLLFGISFVPIVYFAIVADLGEMGSEKLIEALTVHSYWVDISSSYISALIAHGYWRSYLTTIIIVTIIGLIIGKIESKKIE
ncbi:MAG: hypothetical protein COV33_00090 [Candidatus Zambryskibacteria bacterium CG10_big_fil_rev_8_21_14_0_10_34_34]|uniref:Uncharacterized protein n=1 Tax=Candidatus Zambryskibacteria bacterium CG10_big_fil_rev_8_21_14_0_10_34_34 TaxID=1975114 RepID=A0A2H0R1F6_9BACT|nr:MAG: hypothetical protein COV33_00090 [Candidatus Zambryskibacteria bacterium CG10_big_fil_rev_8_21_14_0_10_34_34]